MKSQRIRTKPDLNTYSLQIGGWLSDGRGTYLWLGREGKCIGVLSGAKLYRLAKAIVRRFEAKP